MTGDKSETVIALDIAKVWQRTRRIAPIIAIILCVGIIKTSQEVGIGFSLLIFSFFPACLIYEIIKSRRTLLFNALGVTHNSTRSSFGFIPWSEIIEGEVVTEKTKVYLVIKVKNPEKFIPARSGRNKLSDRRVFIFCTELKIDPRELQTIFQTYHDQFRANTNTRFRSTL